ncbi:hypothetical protein [Eubacterium sp. 1001713B170207_170306_E7]|uniref:hypothetical protein n=1 Tax=Eubacterium sp. 1001713B170207_170306_E7 TaxID=2787097 RepID=UPI001897EFDF|nr:hypothetical protein [Eubacterium sp. 1001713B170207_170306_E7]
MPVTIEELPSTIDLIQGLFVSASGQMAGMLVPVLTAGVVVSIGILAFTVGKRLLNKSVK